MGTWDDWSDFDINLAVAKGLGFVVSKESHGHSAVEARGDDGYHAWITLDYCNNPADMWPIILDNSIEISPLYRGEWCASPIDKYTFEEDPIYNLQSVHKNPLRAAAIAFLMMNGVKPI